ncbi:response regulator transcription factor [Dyadobacter aurulentus]|uniref:response regulator transcription factor n=1 Tax=Dyadobacter sp. UC 10 TaxID=2605428 RepID=UPI0011F3C4FF|nr:response regulator transcription factor [Dyadobacter sp. UC 10]KAA0992040.1 response regulator [Dyadobacter sp. UC 10]
MTHSVLIADDHQLVRKGPQLVVKEILGFNTAIEFAKNGSETIEKIKTLNFSMLLTDLNMPETDELGIITQVLKLDPKLRIIVITVRPDRFFAKRFFREGVMAYINKMESDRVLNVENTVPLTTSFRGRLTTSYDLRHPA